MLWPETSESNARSNLRAALWRARKAFETANAQGWDYLRADDQTIQLSLQPGDWLDVLVLDEKINSDASRDNLIRMVSVYGGELLPGFYEEWVVLERQRLQAVYERKMGLLLDNLLAESRWVETLEWGERWIAKGNIPEPAYRALMIAHAGLGDLAGAVQQYQRCVEVLSSELGVGPSDQTRQALAQIQAGHIKQTGKSVQVERLAGITIDTLEPPEFLRDEAVVASTTQPIFVGREDALSILQRYLNLIVSGKGQLVFVSGEAGSGKSSILQTFVRRAVADHPELVAAFGTCNAFFGQGDAYLPFREALTMLTGEAERPWRSGLISRDHAQRLWALLPAALQAILEVGPDLIDSLVPGQALLGRAEAALSNGNVWLKGLREHLARRLGDELIGQGQAGLIEEYLQVLRRLAEKQPLIIALDDLQWVDSGSIQLLFHLARQIQDARILILGAFRPEDVAAVREGNRHTLEALLHECQRIYGDIELDLDHMGERSGRLFVDAFLDAEPNSLDEDFRSELYRRTGGQPLFTNQLLRYLQEQDEVTLDAQNHWIASPELNWDVLPPQVEGVIGERFGRLDHELQEILSVASVEGEEFTVQVVEKLQEIGGRELLHRLSRDLEKRHRLVRELGEVQVEHQRLVRFRFTHALIQEYLYRQLGESERRMLHNEVAAALEKLYADDPGSISVQLARHYTEAGEKSRAIHYLLQAGDQARARYAHQEAIAHYQQALSFQKDMGDTEGAAHSLLKLNLVYHSEFDFQHASQALQEGLALWQRAVRSGKEPALTLAMQPYRLPEIQEVTLDPAIAVDIAEIKLTAQLFCGLVALSDTLNVIPMAAKSWKVEDRGRLYIFHLRQDLFWSDGKPVTARDFEFAWKRVLDPATHSPLANLLYGLRGARSFHRGQISDVNRVGVTASDLYTLIVEMEEPAGYFPYILATSTTFAVPEHVVERYGMGWTEAGKIVSNAAYQLDAWEPGRIMRFSRNPFYPDYFHGNVDQVEIFFYPDYASINPAFISGQLDAMEITSPIIQEIGLDHYRETGQLSMFAPSTVDLIYFPRDRPPFDDLRLRKAFVLATDKEELANEVLKGLAIPATGGVVPPALPGHSPGIGLPYDLEKARRLLAEAGYPNGQGFPPLILGVWEGMKTTYPLFLQESWKRNLGITVQMEWWNQKTSIGENWHFLLGAWGADFPDPESFLGGDYFLGGAVHLQHAGVETLIESGRRILNQEHRLELYRQADRILIEEAIVAPILYFAPHALLQPWVHYPGGSTIMRSYWKDIILNPH